MGSLFLVCNIAFYLSPHFYESGGDEELIVLAYLEFNWLMEGTDLLQNRPYKKLPPTMSAPPETSIKSPFGFLKSTGLGCELVFRATASGAHHDDRRLKIARARLRLLGTSVSF